jgi:hypothetical protein
MNFFFRTIISFLLLFKLSGISAQQSGIKADDVYGSDPLLYNGRYYTFFLPSSTGGNQYFFGRQFENGSATIRGVIYNDLKLNYDIYDQNLILQYKNNIGANNLIIISDAWLESFSFRELNFEIISSQDTLKRIFQVLGTGPVRILYYWEKKLKLDNIQGSKNYVFSNAIREMNVYIDKQILRFRNNKNFYSLFDPEKRIAIRGYLRKNNINVKKATDQTMTGLIYYCNSLYTK